MLRDLRGLAPGIQVATLDAAGLSVHRKLILTAPGHVATARKPEQSRQGCQESYACEAHSLSVPS
jgi:hypothetical protein